MKIRYSPLIISAVFALGCAQKSPAPARNIETQTTTTQRSAEQTKAIKPKTAAKNTLPNVAKASETKITTVLSKPQAQARLAAGASLFDARSASEFEVAHLPNAINVPLELLGPTLPALESYKTKEILVVGKDDKQVESMRTEMLKAGFKNVLNAASLNS